MPYEADDFVSPINVLANVTAFFGGKIDLDPASSENANTIVAADRFYTPADNGLKQGWKASSIYLYPPRSVLYSAEQPPNTALFVKQKRFVKSAQRVWIEEALKKYTRNEFDEGVLFITSTEVAIIVLQKLKIDFPVCIMKTHPRLFWDTPALDKVRSNKCYGFIYYMPPLMNTHQRIGEFIDTFETLGRVYH